MKNILLKLFACVSIVVCLNSCGLFRCGKLFGCKSAETNRSTEVIMKAYAAMINARQLDSLCSADNLSRDLNEWMHATFYDYETNTKITKYVWINSISEDIETTYIIVPVDTLYDFTKRIIDISKETEE